MKIDKYGKLKTPGIEAKDNKEIPDFCRVKGKKRKGGNIMTILIIVAVIVGMTIGYFVIRKIFVENMADFDSVAGLGIK